MRPIASSPGDVEPAPDDAAFTLTEMAASLVIAAMLVSGLGEITRQFARTTVRVRATLEETRDVRLAQAELLALERADAGELRVLGDEATATIGDREARFALSTAADGTRDLTWTLGDGLPSDTGRRSIQVESAARLELGADGVVRLWEDEGEPPLLIAAPRREAPFDCQYDVVVRDCR